MHKTVDKLRTWELTLYLTSKSRAAWRGGRDSSWCHKWDGEDCVVWDGVGWEGLEQLYKNHPFNHLKSLWGYNSHSLDEETETEIEELGSFQSAEGNIWRESPDSRFGLLTIMLWCLIVKLVTMWCQVFLSREQRTQASITDTHWVVGLVGGNKRNRKRKRLELQFWACTMIPVSHWLLLWKESNWNKETFLFS